MASVPQTMALIFEQPLVIIDDTTEIMWPADPPDAPEFKHEEEPPKQLATPVDPRSCQCYIVHSSAGTDVLQEQAARLPEIRKMSLMHYVAPLYSHLPNVEIDWDLDGPASVCHVVGPSCYGRDQKRVSALKKHLQRKMHVQHDANLTQRQTPSLSFSVTSENSTKRTAVDYLSPPTSTKKPRLEHTVQSSEFVGHDLEWNCHYRRGMKFWSGHWHSSFHFG
ncbi:hypothetical protein FPOA_05719 [Fusarium poae]|uniref:Uncharacterized protein n=1 Tax=Fusarium poae TaxID=36050 RepID=A0A1B8AXP2_FUSPO|nr:hypothetical protein FPOA_05719 [Fusarium poae]